MKKIFTMIAVVGATVVSFTASAGNNLPTNLRSTNTPVKANSMNVGSAGSDLRAAGCDTIANVTANDQPAVSSWSSPSSGYVSGNGVLNNGTSFTEIGVGEEFSQAGLYNSHVTAAFVDMGVVVINPTDSNMIITAYVYSSNGTSAVGGNAPGAALDSAKLTLKAIATAVSDTALVVFNFTNQPTLPTGDFFITMTLPQTTGDTLALVTNSAASSVPQGDGWINLTTAGWLPYDSIMSSPVANYVFVSICGTACPTISVTATQNDRSATASASGGVGTYTYAWSNGQSGATASGLTTNTYTVTATDANGCVGTGTISINTTGISEIGAGVANFSVYPNPSTGVFTASVRLTSASDVVITVLDITGSKVYESTESNVSDLTKAIDLSSAAPGIYIVNVKTNSGTANQRLTISK